MAAKIGIGGAAHRDPVGVRVRSPSQMTPFANSLSPQGSVTEDAKLPRTVGFGIPKLLNVLAAREIDDAVGSCPTSLGLDGGRLFDGSPGSIRWCHIVNPNWALRVRGTRLPREERTGPACERQCSAIILPLRCSSQRSSWAISFRWGATRGDPKARPSSAAHRGAAAVARALGHGLARGVRFGRDVALVTQT